MNKHLPGDIDPVDRRVFPKEWLEQIIQSKIRPRIDGIIIHPISVAGDQNQVIYVVEIPKGYTAHQADDKRYYKRFNFNSEPMYDYEIRDILNRAKFPDIELELLILHSIKENTSFLSIEAFNKGKALALYAFYHIEIPGYFLPEMANTYIKHRKKTFSYDNTIQDLISNEIYGPKRDVPILPMSKKNIAKIELAEYYYDYPDEEITYIIYADNAEPKLGKIAISKIKSKPLSSGHL